MSYIYSLISKDPDLVLSEYTAYVGNFMQLLRVILQKKKKNEIKTEIEYDNYKITFFSEDNITFLLLSEGVSSKAAFAFLNDVKLKMYQLFTYEAIMEFSAYQMSSFNSELQKIMEYYSSHPSLTLFGDLLEGNDSGFQNKSNIDSYIDKDQKVQLVISKKEDNPLGKNNMLDGSSITALNIEAVSNEIKKDDEQSQIKSRSKGYMILAGGLTSLLVFFYCII